LGRAALALVAVSLLALSAVALEGQPRFRGSVSGIVVDPQGNPVEGAVIEVYSGGLLVKMIRTLSSGIFYAELEPGTYSVKIVKEGFATYTRTVKVSPGSSVDLGLVALENAIALSAFPSYLRVGMGEEVEIPLSVENRGEVEISCDATVSSEVPTKLVYSGVEVRSFALRGGEKRSLTLVIGPCYEPGEYAVNLTLTPSCGYPVSKSMTVSVYKPEVEFLLCDFPAKVFLPGDDIKFNVRVVNPFGTDVYVELNLSLPRDWEASILTSSGERVRGLILEARKSASLRVWCRPPPDVKGGSYEIVLSGEMRGLGNEFNVSDSLTLVAYVESGRPLVSASAETPVIDAYSGSQAKFRISLSNVGTGDAIVDLRVEGLPEGYSWRIQDAEGNVISSIYLPVGGTKKVFLVVRVPYGEEPVMRQFSFIARTRGGHEVRLQLGLNVLGKYEISYKTEVFSTEMPIGGTAVYQLVVENSGANELTNVRLVVTHVPEGFNVSVSPSCVESLRPGETVTFTITLGCSSDINAGDYYLTVKVVSDQVESEVRQLRVSLYQRSEVVYVALAVLMVALMVVSIAYRKYGRR